MPEDSSKPSAAYAKHSPTTSAQSRSTADSAPHGAKEHNARTSPSPSTAWEKCAKRNALIAPHSRFTSTQVTFAWWAQNICTSATFSPSSPTSPWRSGKYEEVYLRAYDTVRDAR